MRRLVLVPLIAALLATPALAAEEKPQLGQYVDLATVALPVVWQGRLINYVFVSVRLNLRANVDAFAQRAKEPYFRDALVRAAHRHPFTRSDDFTHLDTNALAAAMMAESARLAGPGVVTGVVVTNQTPQRQANMVPKPPGKGGKAP
jgi:hypothetical protein